MSAPASRPVHPCVVSLTEGSRSAEFSTWAHITTRKPRIPNLITAAASTINIYSVHESSGKLRMNYTFGSIAGSVIFLAALSSGQPSEADALLVGFAGHPRLTVLRVQDSLLQAECLLDLTPAIQENSFGSVTAMEQDAIIECTSSRPGVTTVACILGGGVAVAVLNIHYSKKAKGWLADEPFILPLMNISPKLPHLAHLLPVVAQGASNLGQSISTGFGDILHSTFLPGYLETVLVLLHSNPGGQVWSGRLGRKSGGAEPLYVTAMSLNVDHKRTAVLWSLAVPSDAHSLSQFGNTGCLVMGVNSLVMIEAGEIQQILAVNGWARSTCPAKLEAKIEPNPIIKLAISLDGSSLAWLSPQTALVSLRGGQLYVLQQTSQKWILLPTGHALGGVGEVASLISLPFAELLSAPSLGKVFGGENFSQMSIGLVFAGSRMGDSVLLGFALETVQSSSSSAIAIIKQEPIAIKAEDSDESLNNVFLNLHSVTADVDRILQMEEDELYAVDDMNPTSDVVPPSDDEESRSNQAGHKRSRRAGFSIVRALIPMDVLVNLGPLGPSCHGPISPPPSFLIESQVSSPTVNPNQLFGASTHIFPCGFGSSGGLALVTVPGRDDRHIIVEEDCLNMEAMFSLPRAGLVLIGRDLRSGRGIRVLKFQQNEDASESSLNEVDLTDWCVASSEANSRIFSNALECFANSTLLAAGEFGDGTFSMLLSINMERECYVLATLTERNGHLNLFHEHELTRAEPAKLTSVTDFMSSSDSSSLTFGCLWSSGEVDILTVEPSGKCIQTRFDSMTGSAMEVDGDLDDDIQRFYLEDRVVAIDVFHGPRAFRDTTIQDAQGRSTEVQTISSMNGESFPEASEDVSFSNIESTFIEEDDELYATANTDLRQGDDVATHPSSDRESLIETIPYAAVCRQSGILELYTLPFTGGPPTWSSFGCGLGASSLKHGTRGDFPIPKSHKVSVKEMRFFYCGPTSSKKDTEVHSLQSFCFAVETTIGDFSLYELPCEDCFTQDLKFDRIPLRLVSRTSQEQGKHHSKLVRKGVTSKELPESEIAFQHKSLFVFKGISGQDGLFFAGRRPLWIVSERGKPTALAHRFRHAAPAGGKPKPITAFCCGFLQSGEAETHRAFVTIHERVGRVGSQRMTTFSGLPVIGRAFGLLPGGGYCVEKIRLGVTVRKIKFLDNEAVSTQDHPLYAMIVSREVDTDQSVVNSDGLSDEERQRLEDEKESAKLMRQVEADLGGFDVESEWVEEIEREDCFKIDLTVGGAPPLRQSKHALWIVDAANKWMVVDSFELGDNEYAMTLEAMNLSEFQAEPGSSTAIDEDDLDTRYFVTVGTGTLDHNGEDVGSSGKAMLFEVKRPVESSTPVSSSSIADLSLCYEKEIFHGPVTSLGCLSSEGRHRLVIGAGADVNIEQWGNNRLTQVGFFRATMQILDIMLFKNFFLLSDAYDSLYFLVWRESDKSLTLLSKDYDPIPVYAAGIMSRGAAMTFVCHDDRQNLQFFQYAPGEAAARGGNKLVCRADCHLGSQTTAFISHFCRSSLISHSATTSSTLTALKQQDPLIGRSDDDQRLGVHFGTTDGTLGSIVPVSEPVYWRLAALQSVMSNALESDCALSARAWRLYRRTPRRGGCRSNDRKKGVIDGDLLLKYADLSISEQEDLASAIGSTVNLILDNLLELQCSTMIL